MLTAMQKGMRGSRSKIDHNIALSTHIPISQAEPNQRGSSSTNIYRPCRLRNSSAISSYRQNSTLSSILSSHSRNLLTIPMI